MSTMLSPEEIAEQQQLLAAHRRTLAIYLKQQAMIGRAYSPPVLINGIEDARSNIRRIKRILNAAGVAAPNDPDDDSSTSTLPRPVALPTQGGLLPRWQWPVVAGILAIVLAIGGWWVSSQPKDTSSQEATPPALEEATPPGETPSTESNAADLEGQLTEANIALSAVQVEQVREYINDSSTGYKLLAEHALQVVGDQKFRDTLYLDELDTRYTDLVGQDHYAEFNEERLKEAMVRAWNEHYTDRQVDSFDQIVESRS
jgi:hypothetical protein